MSSTGMPAAFKSMYFAIEEILAVAALLQELEGGRPMPALAPVVDVLDVRVLPRVVHQAVGGPDLPYRIARRLHLRDHNPPALAVQVCRLAEGTAVPALQHRHPVGDGAELRRPVLRRDLLPGRRYWDRARPPPAWRTASPVRPRKHGGGCAGECARQPAVAIPSTPSGRTGHGGDFPIHAAARRRGFPMGRPPILETQRLSIAAAAVEILARTKSVMKDWTLAPRG